MGFSSSTSVRILIIFKLELSQLHKNVSPEGRVHCTYTENVPKNRCGGVRQLSVANKAVHQFQDAEKGEKASGTSLAIKKCSAQLT